ncbi:cytochrome P450 [Actinomadura scrupuli]|uniref:cytochrome P450 n=1 Tax=Actinomadura scrupuli TaxID=559629 RepID=UPI003D965C47
MATDQTSNSPSSADCPYVHPIDTAPRLALHPLYDEVRGKNGGVAEVTLASGQVGEGERVWLVTRYRDVQRVLRDQTAFSLEAAMSLHPELRDTLLGLDGDAHREVRALVADAFTRPAVATYRPTIVQVVEDLLDEMEAGPQPADLFEQLGLSLALRTIGRILGVPAKDLGQFRAWGDAFLGHASREAAAAAHREMSTYLGDLIEQRRNDPAGDLISTLAARAPTDMAAAKVVNLPIALILAGWETTASAVSLITLWLLTNPYGGQHTAYQYLVAHPEKIPGAVWELLRACPVDAADNGPRRVMRNVVISGQRIPAGDWVIASHAAANRDHVEFPDPYRVDLDRTPNRHLSFGYGPHHCIGVILAQAEVEEAITALLRRFPTLHLANGFPTAWKTGVGVRGPSPLLVTWDQAGQAAPGSL